MADEADQHEDGLTRPALKVPESRVNVVTPWTDDELDRQKIAERLTGIIKDQEAPFVISLDGRWGTGKTFLLKRWQQQLVNDRYQAIYFNAWEDDFCDDPLLAIIGQLTEHFQEGKLREMAAIIGDIALPILTGKLTGVPFTRKDLKRDSLLNDYRTQLRTKREIRNHLARLAEVVKAQSGKPLIFIIDELDRCRPTFAIELLERVKHIFDVPNIVFVFGINRAELAKSLESVYGEIDAGVYLRRFFDMEFILPEASPQDFCSYLVDRYELAEYFSSLSKHLDDRAPHDEFSSVSTTLPLIVGHIGLSLRDIDYCVRLLALAARSVQRYGAGLPSLFVLLVAVKISKPELYRRVVHGNGRGAELLDYMDERHAAQGVQPPRSDSRDWRTLVVLEATVYCADDGPTSLNQIRQLQGEAEPDLPQYLTRVTANSQFGVEAHASRMNAIADTLEGLISSADWDPFSLPSVASRVELSSEALMR